MKSKKRITICLFVAFCLSAGGRVFCASLVTATGMSFFEPGRELVAKEKALDEAKRKAVEKALGVHLESTSLVENYQTVRDQILSHSSGYLKGVKVIDEKKTELGSYEVTIEAEVEAASLVNDVSRFEKQVSLRKNPRFLIRISPGTEPGNMDLAERLKGIISSRLQDNGFVIIHSLNTDAGAVPGLILELGVEASTKTTDYQGMEITVNEIALSTSVIRPGDKVVLATANAVSSVAGEDKLRKLELGAEKCVSKVWNELRHKLVRTWEKEMFGVREIALRIKSVKGYQEAKKIAGIMKSDVRGVVGCTLLDFKGQSAAYSVKYRGRAEYLVDAMGMSYFRTKYFDFDVHGVSTNGIVLKKD